MANLLLVEDNKLLSLMEAKHLRSAFPGLSLCIAQDVTGAIDSAKNIPPQVIVMDCKLPGGDCCSLLNELLNIAPKATVVVTSAEPPRDLRGRSYRDKIFDILEKPFETEELVCVVDRALKATGEPENNNVLMEEVGRELISSPPPMGPHWDRHQVLNTLSGILAGIRAFEADIEAESNDKEATRKITSEYVPRLVDMVNKVTRLIKAAGH